MCRALVARIRLAHPFPSFLVAALTVVLVRQADPGAAPGLYVTLGGGMLLYQFAIGIVNDLVDVEDDRATKPWKALPHGLVSRRAAVALGAGCAGAGMLVTLRLDSGAWLIGVAGLLLGLAYDAHFKRTSLSWLPLSVALPLIPAWVYVAAGAWEPYLWLAFPLGALLGLALSFANQSPDVAAERARGVRGAAHRVGPHRSRAVALAAFGFAASAVVFILAFVEPDRAAYAAIAAATVALLAGRATRLFGRDGLFGLMAAGSAVLAAIFLSAA